MQLSCKLFPHPIIKAVNPWVPQHACPKGNLHSWCWRKPRNTFDIIWSSPRLLIDRNEFCLVVLFWNCILSRKKKYVMYPIPYSNCRQRSEMVAIKTSTMDYPGFSLHIHSKDLGTGHGFPTSKPLKWTRRRIHRPWTASASEFPMCPRLGAWARFR